MSRAALLVILGSATILGGAWLAARALTSDVTLPPPPEARAFEVPAPPPTPMPSPRDERPQPVPAATPAPAPQRAPEAAVAPPTEEPSEYASEHSPEVERAWDLAFGRKSNPLRWRQAARVFAECISEVPTNRRCQEGLAATQSLIRSTKRLPGASQLPEPSERPARRPRTSRGSDPEE